MHGSCAPFSASRTASISCSRERDKTDDRRVLNCARNRVNRCKIAWRCRWKASFDTVHAQLLQLQGDLYLFLRVQVNARRLLSVTKRCIENINFPHLCLHLREQNDPGHAYMNRWTQRDAASSTSDSGEPGLCRAFHMHDADLLLLDPVHQFAKLCAVCSIG